MGSAARLVFAFGLALTGCSDGDPPTGPLNGGLRFNEIVANNEGVYLDELGEADDYLELVNGSDVPLNLRDYAIVDESGTHALPEGVLAPGEVKLLFADDSPEQGARHLPFKISAGGELLRLLGAGGAIIDEVSVPPLAEHHAYLRLPDGTGSFMDCGFATPERLNGTECGPRSAPPPPDDVSFAPFTWPAVWPAPSTPLAITEAALRPAEFVEIANVADASLDLSEYELRLASHPFGKPWPSPSAGAAVALTGMLAPGARQSIALPPESVGEIAQDPGFEGTLSLFRKSDGAVIDRVDFNAWPDPAVLARVPDDNGRFRFCSKKTPGAPNEVCADVPTRPVSDHLRNLLTPGDFHALAVGGSELGTESVKFVIDWANGGVVTFLSTERWDLHYTFIREKVDGQAPLDRCDPAEYQVFFAGWSAFSAENYFRVEGRRYLLGTLVEHAGTGLHTVEFTPGDEISPEQMKLAFFTVLAHVPNPQAWAIRPQGPQQVERARAIEGQAPIVGPNAPFRGVTFQPLTAAVAFGTLRFVPSSELMSADLGPRDIVVTDQVPNDVPLIGGLVTEALQTPLAHVNILSKGRRTPNMALVHARTDARFAQNLGRLVRLEVTGSEFTLREASAEEALAFWESRRPQGPPLAPRLDTTLRGVQPLSQRSIQDLPAIGGKAAQLAALSQFTLCSSDVIVPREAFAIPVVHSIEHFEASGARALLSELRADPNFLAVPSVRGEGLARVRARIRDYPLDPELEGAIANAIAERYAGQPVRFRSSGNAEDLAGFSGAGLYSSVGVDPDEARGIAGAVREVWASLWELRAYDERDYYNVSQDGIGMGVLVHQAFKSERANGVAISRNVLDPSQGRRQYFNVQVGEALVTNPAPGVQSEQFSYERGGWLPFQFLEESTFRPGAHVLTDAEVDQVSCNLAAIEEQLQPLLDPERKNPWFAVDIEFKLMGDARALVIKQARPYSFGREAPAGFCDYY